MIREVCCIADVVYWHRILARSSWNITSEMGGRARFESVTGDMKVFGGLTQLGECLLCKQDAVGSIPSTSTKLDVLAQIASSDGIASKEAVYEAVRQLQDRFPGRQ